MSPTPHDALFKATFSDPVRAMDVFREVYGKELLAAFDLSSAELVAGSFVDEALRARMTDLLFRVQTTHGPAYAYLLFEHQSAPDPLMPYRVLRYVVRVIERHLDESPGEHLPVVLPLVLSHHPDGWGLPLQLSSLYDLPADSMRALGRFLPGLELVIEDLSHRSDADLRGRATDALAKLVLLALKHTRTADDVAALVLDWGDLIRPVLDAPSGFDAFARVTRYLLSVRRTDHHAVGRAVELAAGPVAKEVLMTTADELIQEGLQRGLQQGMQQGMQQGELRAARRLLSSLLQQRFGTESARFQARVDGASFDDVERWTLRIAASTDPLSVFDP